MGTTTATFAVELKDETSSAAVAAANSLSVLKGKIDDDVKALREMQKAMKQLQSGDVVPVKAFRELQGQIDKTKNSIASNRAAFVDLGGTFGKTKAKAAAATRQFAGLGDSLKGATGPLGKVTGGIGRLGALLANPIALVIALASAFIALGAAIGVATAALLRFAVTQSDARRSEALQIEGLNTLRTQYGRTTASVEAMQAAIDRASDSTNIGRGTLATYARQLSRAGLRGDALTDAVEAMGIAAQVQGDRGANRFRALAINARLTGGSVRALAEDYRNRLGPIARRQMLSLDNQTTRLRRSLDRIFSGLRIEPFLSSLDEMLSLFSQSTATGRALKVIAEAIFQPMIEQVGVLGPVVKRFFQGMVIATLIAVIGFLRLRNAFREAFGDDELFANVDALEVALFAGILAMSFMIATAVTLVAVFALLAFGVAAVAAAFLFIPLTLLAIVAAFSFLGLKIGEFLGAFDFVAFGQSLIDGLVNGITSGTARVVAAMAGMAGSATSAFRSALGIASPSSVFAGYGMNISQGVEQGIDAGVPGVEDSVSGLVDVPTGGGVSGGATSISIGDIIMSGAAEGGSAREQAEAFRDELARVLEGVNIELGFAT